MGYLSIFFGYRISTELFCDNAYEEVKQIEYSCYHLHNDEKMRSKKFCSLCGTKVSSKEVGADKLIIPSQCGIEIYKPKWNSKYVFLTKNILEVSSHDFYKESIQVEHCKDIYETIKKYFPTIHSNFEYGLWIIDDTDYGSDCW